MSGRDHIPDAGQKVGSEIERSSSPAAGSVPRRPWVASSQYGMQFVLSADSEILWRADWMPMEMLRAMVKAANEVQAPNTKALQLAEEDRPQ